MSLRYNHTHRGMHVSDNGLWVKHSELERMRIRLEQTEKFARGRCDRIDEMWQEVCCVREANEKLRAALQLAKDMFITNDLSLPHTFEVIDDAQRLADGDSEQ